MNKCWNKKLNLTVDNDDFAFSFRHLYCLLQFLASRIFLGASYFFPGILSSKCVLFSGCVLFWGRGLPVETKTRLKRFPKYYRIHFYKTTIATPKITWRGFPRPRLAKPPEIKSTSARRTCDCLNSQFLQYRFFFNFNHAGKQENLLVLSPSQSRF